MNIMFNLNSAGGRTKNLVQMCNIFVDVQNLIKLDILRKMLVFASNLSRKSRNSLKRKYGRIFGGNDIYREGQFEGLKTALI